MNAPGISPGVELVLDEREVVLLDVEDTVELELKPERAEEVELDTALSWTVTEAAELLDEADAAVDEDVVAVVDEDATGEYM